MATPEPQPNPDVPRVLLFGHRGAGKSALIGALLQAGETQGETLRGEVVSSSVDLPRIRDAVYSGKLESTNTELASFIIRLRPWRIGTQPLMEPLTVILDDCDGRAAESLMAHPEPITQREPNSPIARAVVECDAIALLVDASSTREELAEAFAEFNAFLKVVGQAKLETRCVGGFPVFLVLTQCDRLAQPDDTQRIWEVRVNERTEYAWNAFDAFLKDAHADAEENATSPFLAFGSLELNVFAVAIRRPPLSGAVSTGDQPYHVAELFRDCFAEAKAHHNRVQRSNTRLKWTVRIALAALAFLFTMLAFIAFFPPEASGPDLAELVDDYQRQERPAAERLADEQIDRNKKTLTRFQQDRGFANIGEDRRAFVVSRLKEIDDYQDYRAKLANAIPPAATRTTPELTRVRTALNAELALPPEYSWGETAAAKLRDKWIADCKAIADAQQVLIAKYREHDLSGIALTLKRTFDANWLNDVDSLFALAANPPFPLTDAIPNSPAINHTRGSAVTYRVPFEFDEVYRTRRDWEQTRDLIIHLRDLADALGMIDAPNRPPPVLLLPEPNGTNSATLAGERWNALVRTYTRQTDDYSEWETRLFPDPVRGEINARLQKSFATGVRHIQSLFKVEDTVAGWNSLGASLNDPQFREWAKLLHLLARLQQRPDPVTELADFLRELDKKTFELDLRGFELTIPLDLTLDRIEPSDTFIVTVTHADQSSETAKFTLNKGETRGITTVYQLVPNGNTKLAYRAGDSLTAELPVKAGTRELKLLWDTGVSKTFRFDRLSREPRLTKPTGGTEPATGVTLVPKAKTAIPQFPALFPLR
jgi:hypothetical protein